MVIDGDGIPVCSEMWPGNTTDVTTLDWVAGRLQSRFGLRRVCLVADAGMISKKMIAAVEARGWFYSRAPSGLNASGPIVRFLVRYW